MPNQLEETLGVVQRQKQYLMGKLKETNDKEVEKKILEELEELTRDEQDILNELIR